MTNGTNVYKTLEFCILLIVNNSNFVSVFFKLVCHVDPGVDNKQAGSSPYISINLFLKFSNVSASNNVSL